MSIDVSLDYRIYESGRFVPDRDEPKRDERYLNVRLSASHTDAEEQAFEEIVHAAVDALERVNGPMRQHIYDIDHMSEEDD